MIERSRASFVLAVTVVAAAWSAGHAVGAQPNIILMLSDDQGWDGLSVAMAPGDAAGRGDPWHTPCLERMAAQGMRFSCAYAPSPVCSPTRISLQTGRSPAALHWTKAAPAEEGHLLAEPRLVKRISADEVTIGEVLRAAGYATAHYGKWHISGGGPGDHGYDEHDGDTGNEQAERFTDPNPVDIFGMAERAEAFMQRSRQAGKPFFIQLSWNALHAAHNARQATLAKYARLTGTDGRDKRTAVYAITEDLDEGVGRVLDAVDRHGLADTTYVIYMSDNGAGGGGRRGGLSGGKGSVWEGGIRVPFIVRGPGVEAGSWCHVPIVGYDLFPTFCDWAAVPADARPTVLEGGSIAGLVAGGGQGQVLRPREELLFHFPHYQSGHTPHSAIRVGDLKLIRFYEDDSVKLFDLQADRSERNDLAEERPDVAAALRTRLDAVLAAVDAQLPTRNPAGAAGEDAPRRGKGGRRGGRNAETTDRPDKKKGGT